MNKQEQDIFFALLRNALFSYPIPYKEWKGEWTWNPILETIKAHVLETLMTEPIMSLPENLRPSPEIQSELLQYVMLNTQEHYRLNADICKVFSLLEENGFHPVLLKGQGNATFYPNPLLRKCGDVDIYIGEEDYERACEFLLSALPQAIRGRETDKHLDIRWGQTELEIHKFAEKQTYPQKDAPYQKLSKDYLNNPASVAINGMSISVPPEKFLVVYLFNHLWSHFKFRNVGLRQYSDLALVLHFLKNRIDNQKLKNDLKELGLWKEWGTIGCFLVKKMGLPIEAFPFFKKKNNWRINVLANMVLKDENFKSQGRYKNRFTHFCLDVYVYSKRYVKLSMVSFPLAVRVFYGTIIRGFINMKTKGSEW